MESFESRLTAAQISAFEIDGYLLIPAFLDAEAVYDLQRWVTDVASWSPGSAASVKPYTMHYEGTGNSRMLCRVENFCGLHGGLDELARDAVAPLVGQLLGGTAVLFKEKINIKQANGGRGYWAHYDGPSAASLGLAQTFITAQVAVDFQTVENGCLEVCLPRAAWPADRSMGRAGQDRDPDGGGRVGAIPAATVARLAWTPIECAPGDLLLFDHWTPHKSACNTSPAQRRTMYLLFNPVSEGDFHDEYYAGMARLRAEQETRTAAGRVSAVPAWLQEGES